MTTGKAGRIRIDAKQSDSKKYLMRIVTFFLFVLSFTIVHSQIGYVFYGYNVSTYRLDGINAVINNYNETRPWLEEEMKEFHYLDGFSLSFGLGAKPIFVETGYNFRSQKRSVSGTDLYGNEDTRQIKVKNGAFNISFGLAGIFGSRMENLLAFGVRTDIGALKVKTRVFGDSGPKEKMEDIGYTNVTAQSGPMLRYSRDIGGVAMSFAVYYTWSLLKYNYRRLDEQLNYTEYWEDPPQFNLRPNCFGFMIQAGIAGGAN